MVRHANYNCKAYKLKHYAVHRLLLKYQEVFIIVFLDYFVS